MIDRAAVAESDPTALRPVPKPLDLGQPRGFVAEYGLDPGKLAMNCNYRKSD